MADLEEYSDENIKIYAREIYKWHGKYINVIRNSSSNPIDFIKFSEERIINEKFDYKTIQISSNKFLHYSNEGKNKEILYDLKVSFRNEPHTNQKRASNVCFSKFCVENSGLCLNGDSFEEIDSDNSNNFISYNNIEFELKNNIGFYKPENFYLFRRNKIHDEDAKNNLKLLKNLFIAF